MACCPVCVMPRSKHSYLIDLVDDETGQWGQCVVQSVCSHGMQEWMNTLASEAKLYVVGTEGEKFLMLHPRVIHVDTEKAAHLPIVDPQGCGH